MCERKLILGRGRVVVLGAESRCSGGGKIRVKNCRCWLQVARAGQIFTQCVTVAEQAWNSIQLVGLQVGHVGMLSVCSRRGTL